MSLVRFELQRIVRRRGSFYGSMAFATAIALLALFTASPQDETLWANVLGISLVFGASIVGALAGSYDNAEGTMRYLVLTGTPRSRLVVQRVPALVIALVLMAIPAMLIALFAMATDSATAEQVSHAARDSLAVGDPTSTVGEMARALGGSLLAGVAWGIVSMAIGTMLRSNGAGIAAALVLFFVGQLITEFVRDHISQTLGDYTLTNVGSVVSTLGHVAPGEPPITIGLAAASVATVAWLIGLTGLAVLRTQRDEF